MSDRDYGTSSIEDDDDKKLESLGYAPSFKREFSNLATVRGPYLPSPPLFHRESHTKQISFAFSIMACLSLYMRYYYNFILPIGPLFICRDYI